MAYDLADEGKGFFVHQSGDVTFDEIAEANDALLAHPSWNSHTYQIWSYLDASKLIAEFRDARTI